MLILLVSAYAQVSVRINTPWKGPSNSTLLQEAAECLSQIDPNLFWKALQDPHNWQSLVSPQLAKLCWFSLWNREYSARMEFYSVLERTQEGSEECGVSVSGGLVRCGKVKVFDSDHVYRRGSTVIVGYLDMSDKDFLAEHELLMKHSEDINATYVFRHKDTRTEKTDVVGGYGGGMLAHDMENTNDTNINVKTDLGYWEMSGML